MTEQQRRAMYADVVTGYRTKRARGFSWVKYPDGQMYRFDPRTNTWKIQKGNFASFVQRVIKDNLDIVIKGV